MKELLEHILKHITLHPDEIGITESMEDDVTVYTISVNPEDMGRVIGKSGKVIRAIRSLVHVAAIRSNTKARVKLAEMDEGESPRTDEFDVSGESSQPTEAVEDDTMVITEDDLPE